MRARFSILSALGLSLGVWLSRTTAATPEGDRFDAPLIREGTSWTWSGTTFGATREPGEPRHFASVTNSIWFRWTAPATGWVGAVCRIRNNFGFLNTYQVTESSNLGDPYFGLFVYDDAESIADLKSPTRPAPSLAAGSSLSQLWTGSATRFFAEAGKSYRLAFAGFGGASYQPVPYQIWFGYPTTELPENDSLSHAQRIESSSEFAFFSLENATSEAGEPGFLDASGKTLWYRWTPPSPGRYVAEVQMPASMPLLAVYRLKKPFGPTIEFEDLELVHRSQNRTLVEDFVHTPFGVFTVFTATGSSQVDATFQGSPEEEYLLQVDHPPLLEAYFGNFSAENWRTNSMGILTVFPTPVPNDDLQFAREISDNDWIFLDFPAASMEPGEPPLPVSAEGSIWWKWTAGRTMSAAAEGAVDIFTGTGWNDFKPVPIRPGNPSLQILPRFQAIAGTTYYLRTIPVYRTKTSLKLLVEAPNDRIENPLLIQGTPESFEIPRGLGNIDPQEPIPESAYITGVVWFLWRPPHTGRYNIQASGLHVFRRSAEGTLTSIGKPSDSGPFRTVNVANEDSVYIAVETTDSFWPGYISIRAVLPPANDAFEFPVRIFGSWTASWNPDDFLGTSQEGEPAHAGSPAKGSFWYEYIVRQTGALTVRILGGIHPRVALYRGTTLSSLIPLASAEPMEPGSAEVISANVSEGELIRVAVEPGDLVGESLPSSLRLVTIQIVPPPKNDSPETTQAMGRFEVTGTTFGADSEPQIQRPESMRNWSSVWFHYYTGTNGPHVVRLVPTSVSTRMRAAHLRIYRGDTVGDLVLVGQSAPLSGLGPITATFVSQQGRKLWIEVLAEPDDPEFFEIQASPLTRADPQTLFALEPEDRSPRLRLQGPDDLILRLEESSDLAHWQSLGDAQVTREGTIIALPPAITDGPRFIRSRIP
ncbi:MAG: hypothetical protein JNL10_09355 [Verrucomicrobiales bacterium]|nr:hypothetical protein [Verrucomicrobiales bacterium]